MIDEDDCGAIGGTMTLLTKYGERRIIRKVCTLVVEYMATHFRKK
jgi:hypothetical protein